MGKIIWVDAGPIHGRDYGIKYPRLKTKTKGKTVDYQAGDIAVLNKMYGFLFVKDKFPGVVKPDVQLCVDALEEWHSKYTYEGREQAKRANA